MLKIVVVVMLLLPGMSEPIIDKIPTDDYQACIERAEQIRAKAVELNQRGEEFRILVGCEFQSEKANPT